MKTPNCPKPTVTGNTRRIAGDASLHRKDPSFDRKWSWDPPQEQRAIWVTVSRATGQATIFPMR